MFGTQSKNTDILICNGFKNIMNSLSSKKNLLFLRIFIDMLPFGGQFQAFPLDSRLITTTAGIGIRSLFSVLIGKLILLYFSFGFAPFTNLFSFTEIIDTGQSFARIISC